MVEHRKPAMPSPLMTEKKVVDLYSTYRMREGYAIGSGWLDRKQFQEALCLKTEEETLEEAVMRYEADYGIPCSRVGLSLEEANYLRKAMKGETKATNLHEELKAHLDKFSRNLAEVEFERLLQLTESLIASPPDIAEVAHINIGESIVRELGRYEMRAWDVMIGIQRAMSTMEEKTMIGNGWEPCRLGLSQALAVAREESAAIAKEQQRMRALLLARKSILEEINSAWDARDDIIGT